MSRADQSLSGVTPKTWSANAAVGTGSPSVGRGARPRSRARPRCRAAGSDRTVGGHRAPAGSAGRAAGRRRSRRRRPSRRGRGSRSAGAASWRQRVAVGPEDPADVGGVLQRAVEVDVVGHLERQVHRHRRQRDQVRLDALACDLVGEQPREPAPRHTARRRPSARNAFEARPRVASSAVARCSQRCQRRHAVADAYADPRRGRRRPRRRRTAGCRRRTPNQPRLDPDSASALSEQPELDESSWASSTLHEPNEVNQRRVRAAGRVVRRAARPGPAPSVSLQHRRDLVGLTAVEAGAGGEQHVEEAVVREAGLRPGAGRRGAGRPCT